MEEQKTAALNPSGPTDGGQLPAISTDSIAGAAEKINISTGKTSQELDFMQKLQQLQNPNYLPMVEIGELMDQVFTGTPAIIDDLLFQGTYILAGAPKIGKSFLVAQIAYHVSTGQSFWGHSIHPGPVLYLALEDQYRRIQERMARMFGVEYQGNLLISVSAKRIGLGLDGQMEYFLEQYPKARLIIIDTLQKVRELSGNSYSYASDYDVIGQLKKFGERHNVAILIVHHTRKQPSEDSFEMISGTTGLLGCADGALLLHKEKRTDRKAILEVVGRDQPDQRLHLIRNEERLTWELDSVEQEPWREPPNPLMEQIIAMLSVEEPAWQGSATQLADLLGEPYSPSGIVRQLNVCASRLAQYHNIHYEHQRTRHGSSITLTLEIQPV